MIKRFTATVRKHALWLLVALAADGFALLLLWISDARAFWILSGIILLWSFLLFFASLVYAGIRDDKKQKLFQTFLTNPDRINEERLLRAVSPQEGGQIRLLASVLRKDRMKLSRLSGELLDYEEYVESWAHEAKTPLALLTVLLDNRADEIPLDFHAKLDYVRNQMQEDIAQILYYARLKSSTKDYRFEEVNLQSSLADVLTDYAPLLEEKGFAVQNEIGEEMVFTDRRGLEFMLGQIISNAVKYSADAPRLIFSFRHENGSAILTVSDNGIGVKHYDLPYIFQKGFTGDCAGGGKKSTGMGLYLTKKMADDLKVRLNAESEYKKYFSISIYFPEFGRD